MAQQCESSQEPADGDFLGIVAKEQDKWEAMVANMGCPSYLIPDIVQEMYIRLHRQKSRDRILYDNDKVNHFYVYLTLRSCYIDYLRAEKDCTDIPGPIPDQRPTLDMDKEKAFARLWKRVEKEVCTFGAYGAKLTNTYFKTDISIRGLSEGSGISVTSIYNSIRAYRKHLKDTTIGEDWEDYCNEDYDKV